MAGMGRCVPWASWLEWGELKQWLSSCDRAEQRLGVERVAAWRVRGRVTLGVDITASLVEAQLLDPAVTPALDSSAVQPSSTAQGSHRKMGNDELMQQQQQQQLVFNPPSLSSHTLRMRYALSIIRMVNGLADSQQKGRVASSVAILASNIGLPSCLVDVRHEATHHELPSLPLLRVASKQALRWLQENYWAGQASHMEQCDKKLVGLVSMLRESLAQAAAKKHAARVDKKMLNNDISSDEEGDEDSAQGKAEEVPTNADGQRLRKELISQLKTFLPPAWTPWLLRPLLDCGAVDPPMAGSSSSSIADMCRLASKGLRAPSREALVEEQSWVAALIQLFEVYPRLRLLLLQGALQRLCAASADPPHGGHHSRQPSTAPAPAPSVAATQVHLGSDKSKAHRSELFLQWMIKLLPLSPSTSSKKAQKKAAAAAMAKTSGKGFGSKRKRGASSNASETASPLQGDLDAHQILHLLSEIVQGLGVSVAARPPQLVGPHPSPPSSPISQATQLVMDLMLHSLRSSPDALSAEEKSRAEALVQLGTTLLRAADGKVDAPKRSNGQKAQTHRAAAITTSSADPADSTGTAQQEDGSVEGGGASGGDPADVCDDALGDGYTTGLQPQDPEEESAVHGLDASAPSGQPSRPRAGASVSQRQQQHPAAAKRWRVAEGWAACAIGCLPSPMDNNGRLPPLTVPSSLHTHPPTPVTKPSCTAPRSKPRLPLGPSAGSCGAPILLASAGEAEAEGEGEGWLPLASEFDAASMDTDTEALKAAAELEEVSVSQGEDDSEGDPLDYFSSFGAGCADEEEAEVGAVGALNRGVHAQGVLQLGRWQVAVQDADALKQAASFL